MQILLGFDTETTGLIDYRKELSDPSQPRITQLAAVLMDENEQVLDEMCVYIKPDGWVVPPEITELNGTTTEMLEEHGIPMVEALLRFNEMKAQCTDRVAHNASFDKQMLAREAMAYGIEHDSTGLGTICTMKMCKEICQLPSTEKMRGKGFKPPKLQEAYRFFFGEDFDDAHDALADVRACLKVYFAAKKLVAVNDNQGDASRPAGQGE